MTPTIFSRTLPDAAIGSGMAADPLTERTRATWTAGDFGRIVMANRTRTGLIGEMIRTMVRYVPAPAGVPSPLLWGTEGAVRERLGPGSDTVTFAHRLMTFEYPFGPAEAVNQFRLWYGPTLRAFAVLEEAERDGLRRDLEALWTENNRASDGTTCVHSEYLEVVAVVK